MTTTISPELLDPVVRLHLGPEARVAAVARGPVGNGQETWFVDTVIAGKARPLVLRRDAPGGPLDWTDRASEFRTLRALAGSGLPVPVVHWCEDENSALGHPYFVMDRMPGSPPRRENPEVRDRLARELGRWLARLHQIEPEGRPRDPVAAARAELGRWKDRYRDDTPEPMPLLAIIIARLEREPPPPPDRIALLWGDPGPHNTLHEDGSITALLDWELSHAGDPMEDLGSAVWSCLGVLDREVVIAAYEEESSDPVDRNTVTYYEVMACVTRSIMLLTGLKHYLAGETRAPNLAGLGLHLIAANLERAIGLLGWDPAPVPPRTVGPVSDLRPRPDPAELIEGAAAFLAEDVLPGIEDRHLRRGLLTAGALLETAALRHRSEGGVTAAREAARAEIVSELEHAGVDLSGGFEAAALRVETDARHEGLRVRLWGHLVDDLAARRALLRP